MMQGGDFEPPQLGRSAAERAAAAVRPLTGAVWTAAEIMHWAGVHAAPATGIGTALATTVAWGLAGRGKAPAMLPWWIGITGTWFTAAEYLGPLHWWPAPMLSVVWVIIAYALSKAAHRHRAVTGAREWREAKEAWLMTRHEWHLGGSHLLDFERTRLGELYTISTKGTGKRASQILASSLAEVIAEAENLPLNRVRLMPHRLAGRIMISIRRVDPWKGALLHPLVDPDCEVTLPEDYSILDLGLVGMDPETGDPLEVPLYDEAGGKNIAVTGIKGAGKGVLLDNLSERVTAARDAVMVRLNLSVKGYAEPESWGPACHLTAFGPEQASRAVLVLKIIGRIIEWRAKTYKRGQYHPTPGDPAIVVFNDESDSAARIRAVKDGLDMIATKGREYGVTLVHAGQRATNDYSSGKAKSQDDVFCTGLVNKRGEAKRAAAGTAAGMPDMATYGEGRPGVWSIGTLGGTQHTGRTWVFHPTAAGHGAMVEQIARERAFTQPVLPAACRAYLGDEYEILLATEVFTRWAHAAGADGAEPDDDVPAADLPPAAGPAAPQDDDPAAAPAAQAPAAAVQTAVAETDPLEDLEELWKMDLSEDQRAQVAGIHRKLDDARQMITDTAKLPRTATDVDPEALAAHTAERWRQVGLDAQIPEGARPRLLEMLKEGTTISAVFEAFRGECEMTRWTARTWLEKLSVENLAYVDGKGRGARWRAVS